MNNKKKITFGFVLAAVSTVLAIVCAILYKSVVQQNSTTYTLLIFAAVAGVAALVLALVLSGKEIPNLFLIAHAVLLMAAIAISIAPVVNDMGLVFAGLYQMDIISAYITYAVCTCIAWLIAVVAAFTGVTKKAA